MNSVEVRRAYDRVAAEYHERLGRELDDKPFDRTWLERFAERVRGAERVVEVGCGDGHVAAHLANMGVEIVGVDLSPGMIEVARSAYPEVDFEVGDLLNQSFGDGEVDALISFYSIVNLTSGDCSTAFTEFARVLRKGGLLNLAFHIGEERIREDNWWETGAELDFFLHPVGRIRSQLMESGFSIERFEQRSPYDESVEVQTTRAYFLAQRPVS